VARSADHELIRRAALDYFEGWFDGDAARMDRALHEDLVKRDAEEDLELSTKAWMVEATREGRGVRAAGREIEVEITDVYRDIANVTVRSTPYREYLHLVRTDEGWKIASTLYVRT
jgi:hypothetical protein